MADGFAPSIDRVVPPVSGAPETQSNAPSAPMPATSAPPPEPTLPPVTAPPTADDEGRPADEKRNILDGAGPAVGLPKPPPEVMSLPAVANGPKPVEVLSVPQTPLNDRTPAGGTPRPELNIAEESARDSPAKDDDESNPFLMPMTGVQEPLPTPRTSLPNEDSIPEPISDAAPGPGTNGATRQPAEMTGALPPSVPTRTSPVVEKPHVDELPAPVKLRPDIAETKPTEPASLSTDAPSSVPETKPTEGVTSSVKVPSGVPVPAAAVEAALAGEKRKLDGTSTSSAVNAAPPAATAPAAAPAPTETISAAEPKAADEREAKKVKPNGNENGNENGNAADPVATTEAKAPVGRPRKGSKPQKPAAPSGRTERKTRSQGPVEL